MKLTVPDYVAPSICLKSSNQLPEIYTQSLKAAASSRKRKANKTKIGKNNPCNDSTLDEKKVRTDDTEKPIFPSTDSSALIGTPVTDVSIPAIKQE